MLAFIAAAITFVVQYKNKKRENQARLAQQQIIHQKELLSTEVEIQSQTMQHIGREIHDNVGQKLTLASLYTQQLAYENKAPDINEKIEIIGEIINQSLAELRQLSKSLTDNKVEKGNINDLLRQEFVRIGELKKYKLNLAIALEELTLPYQTKSVIVRVTQEFLQNSIKYANCKTLSISASKVEDHLKIVLADDGIGFDLSSVKDKGIGLVSMKKRIELIGGSYLLESKKDEGTRLTVQISL
ncbi:sensor histidine kinase [Pedobacter insulae]|uniref:sensor histidine kinase n=1 Tax=Pedobacter insulae TaxID=414048 RepID=UPI0015A635EF|nr:ATP-binding protein [Pedobacter insulae]